LNSFSANSLRRYTGRSPLARLFSGVFAAILVCTASGSIRVETIDLELAGGSGECQTCESDVLCPGRIRIRENRLRQTPELLNDSAKSTAIRGMAVGRDSLGSQHSTWLTAPLRC